MRNQAVGVIGLGYVGLPVALAFAKRFKTIGFDINSRRIQALDAAEDVNREHSAEELKHPNLTFTSDLSVLKEATFFIVAVPTPVDDAKQPDLTPILGASKTVAKVLKAGDIVVYESTVYPGVTEEVCVPVLEKESGLKCGVDFKVGYSPERINPGDTEHTFEKIKKVVSGQDSASLAVVADMYGAVVKAGVHRASSIKVAEAAKVIENTQRDLNIALMNELAIIFNQMGIDTLSVLEAAGTKWNFLKFKPGLVGGHCIGVDPYYLTHKAEKLNYTPQVILAGRKINDGMGRYVAQKTIKEMIHVGHNVATSTVTVLGLTFKENCRDLRNTRVVDILKELEEYGVKTQVCDPLADPEEAMHEYRVRLQPMDDLHPSQAVIVAVAHKEFEGLEANWFKKIMPQHPILMDVKGTFPKEAFAADGIRVWRL